MKKLHEEILENIPSAVIVLSKNYRVAEVNSAFLSAFAAEGSGRKKTLKDVIGCRENGECGKCDGCKRCPFKAAFDEAFESGTGKTHNLLYDLRLGDSPRKVNVRMNVKPIGKKYCLGVIDGVFEAEIVKELNSAKNIQQRLLPAGKEAGGVSFRYMFIPCRDIGGDLPDVYEVNGRDTFGVIADVSGKGISAGMLSAFVKAGFDRSEPSPAKAIQKLSDKFSELNLDETNYITVAAVRIDSDKRRITYSTAGHNAPILLKSGYGVNEIVQPSPPVSTWMKFDYEDVEIPYKKGDILILLTDGVTESKNPDGEMFGIDRVEGILLHSSSADAFIDKLKNTLTEFCGTFNDDITAIAFDL